MIFTASDVESLSRSLSHWEWAEYISEAFVILACAGELVADLEVGWLTDERKKHIQRRSTILLVAALSVSLICLVRTNELSGSVIGSLGNKAEEADNKAKKAVTDSGTALAQAEEATTKADAAENEAGRAVDKSNEAGATASSALILSHRARLDAKELRVDLEKASADAKAAESKLADAQKQFLLAEQSFFRIARRTGIRTLNTDRFLERLKGSDKGIVKLRIIPDPDSDEVWRFASDLKHALEIAQWNVSYGDMLDPKEPTVLGGGILLRSNRLCKMDNPSQRIREMDKANALCNALFFGLDFGNPSIVEQDRTLSDGHFVIEIHKTLAQ